MSEQFISQAPWRSWPTWSASTTLLDRVRQISKATKLPTTECRIDAIAHLTTDIYELDDIATEIKKEYIATKNKLETEYGRTNTRNTSSAPSNGPVAPSRTQLGMSSSHDINTLTNLEHISALENAENAYEVLLYTRVIANSCPRPMDNTRANKNTALSIIETEVLEKWETTVTQNDTLYQSACVQHINVMLHKWVTALFDTYDTAKQITTNPKRAATNTLPSRPQLANKMCTETTILEKQLKTELLRYCPQTVESNLNRVTCTSQNWTWTTITDDLYFDKQAKPTNAQAQTRAASAKRVTIEASKQRQLANVTTDTETKPETTPDAEQTKNIEQLALIANTMAELQTIIQNEFQSRRSSNDQQNKRNHDSRDSNDVAHNKRWRC